MYSTSVVVLEIPPHCIERLSVARWIVVNNTCEATRRSVSENPAVAAAPKPAVIPGTISKSRPARRNAAISSPARPKSNGSPPFNRTTTSCDFAYEIISALISSCVSNFLPHLLPTSISSARAATSAKTSLLTSASCSTISARPKILAAFKVSSSGSPGPPPTRYTLPFMNCSCRPIPACHSRLRAKISRTFPRSRACARASSSLPDLCPHCAEICAPPPATPATIRIPAQIASRVPAAIAVPAPDSAHRWKLRSAMPRAAPPPDNKSGSAPDHPPRCKEFLPPRNDETLRGSPAPKKFPPPPETRRTNPPWQEFEPAIRFGPRGPKSQPPPSLPAQSPRPAPPPPANSVSSIPRSRRRPPPRTAARAISAKWETEASPIPQSRAARDPPKRPVPRLPQFAPPGACGSRHSYVAQKIAANFRRDCAPPQNFAIIARSPPALPSRRSGNPQVEQSRQIFPPRRPRKSNKRPPSRRPL